MWRRLSPTYPSGKENVTSKNISLLLSYAALSLISIIGVFNDPSSNEALGFSTVDTHQVFLTFGNTEELN
jgi:hypothetical protein